MIPQSAHIFSIDQSAHCHYCVKLDEMFLILVAPFVSIY